MLRSLLMGFTLCLAAGAALADTAALISVETFFSDPQISAAEISPDGKYLAMAVANDSTGLEKSTLVIVGTDDLKPTARIALTGDQSIDEFWWVSDERVLMSTQIRKGGFDKPSTDGGLFGINVDGTKSKVLMGDPRKLLSPDQFTHMKHDNVIYYFKRMIYIPPDDPRHVVVGIVVDRHAPDQAYILDTYTGDVRLVATSPAVDGHLVADNNGEIRLGRGANAKTGHANFFYRDSDSALDWVDLSSLIGKDDPASTPLRSPGFTGDNKEFYWYGRTRTTTLGLYAVDPATKAKQALFEDENNDISGLVWTYDYVLPRHVIAVDTMPGLPAVHILDTDDPKAQYLAQLYQAFPNQRVSITSNTRDHSKMVVHVWSDRNPGDFYLFDTKTSKAKLLFSTKPDIDPDAMASMQPISFKARDGLQLHGYLTAPPGVPVKNLPMVLLVHGGPYGIRDNWGWNREVQFLANRGYAVLQINYRGSGGYGMQFQDIGYRHRADTMQDDLADGVQWAIQQGAADPKRICIYGGSYGGYAAAENAVRYPDLYKCVVGYAGLYDQELAKEHQFVRHYAAGERANEVEMGDDDAELKTGSPVNQADKLKAPMFIIYGGQDKTVVPENSEEMMDALDKAGKPYEKLYERDEGHGFIRPEHNYDLYTQMQAFFDKYIGPGVTRVTAAAAAVTKKAP